MFSKLSLELPPFSPSNHQQPLTELSDPNGISSLANVTFSCARESYGLALNIIARKEGGLAIHGIAAIDALLIASPQPYFIKE